MADGIFGYRAELITFVLTLSVSLMSQSVGNRDFDKMYKSNPQGVYEITLLDF